MIIFMTFAAVFLYSPRLEVAGQSDERPQKFSLPRIGTIKDYSATGLTAGCSNLYFFLPKDAASIEQKYVFIAREKGNDAWMNFDGRDVNLTQIKSAGHRQEKQFRYDYHWGEVFIGVVIKAFKPQKRSEKTEDFIFEMIITLRKCRSSKALRAVGSADC